MPRRRWRGPGWPLLAVLSLVLILGLGGLVVAGVLGLRHGLEQRQVQQATAVAGHFQRALRYLDSGELALAQAELARVLELAPEHEGALARLRELEEAAARRQTPTAAPISTPTPVPTPPPGTPQMGALDALFAEARQLFEQQRWEEAALRLEQLRTLAPDYQPQAVEEMLFQAHYQHGLQLAQADHLEAALRSFDQALALRPDDAAAQEERELTALYAAGVGTWGADWKKTIATFAELYRRRPDYRDVARRLLDAYRQYGDALARKAQWCEAARQYASALTVRDDQEIVRLRDEADYACRTATPTPTATTPVTVTVIPGLTPLPTRPIVGEGHIAFSAFNEETGQEEIWLLPAGGGELVLLAEQASQPALSPDGAWVAFRSQREDMLGLVIKPVSGGAWQRVTHYVEDSVPAWSPDGRRLAFASNREGDRKWRIYYVWADGQSPATMLAFGRALAWAPDGRNIVYQGCDTQGNNCGLRIVNADDGSSTLLTDVPGDTAPAWSPDGRRVAFASYTRDGNWELYLLDLASGAVRALAPHLANDGMPAWSPDGRRLAFLSDRDGMWAIFVLEVDGETAPVRLVDIPGDYEDWLSAQISWGP
ncbi:MAG: hypothetical protein QHJ81_06380 [Anaerolineae bacterium]|nr:hypothetical protein [Anaerolineae bacterium]